MNYNRSIQLFERAQQSIPGGVNSPVRAFKSVGGTPVFISHAKGAYLYDEDGNKYIDYVNSWGPMILGHAYEPVIKAIQEAAVRSTSFGAPTALEIEVAELIKTMAPNIDLVRMVNSGTEACMSAVRLARGYTGKNKILKFEGCYHGHADAFLVKAGSGVATFNIDQVPGVTPGVAADTLTCPYNDVLALEQVVKEFANDLAAIIIEPVAGNMGCVPPTPEFIKSIRTLCDKHRIVFIMDEVMTGFRLAKGGAQEYLNINADLVTYGKVIGAGMPVGAFAGKYDIMKHIAPLGNVYQAGTLSGNPLAMIAGLTLLKALNNDEKVYERLEDKTKQLKNRLNEVFEQSGTPFITQQAGSMMSIFFTEQPVLNFNDVAQSNITLFNKFFHAMLKRGVALPPSAYETWFISDAITEHEIEQTIIAARESLEEIL